MKNLLKITFLAFLPLLFLGNGLLVQDKVSTAYAQGTLDYNEATHLAFMREEEKLARDVYLTLGEIFPAARIFQNISESETRHTDSVLKVLEMYGLEDPNDDDSVGVYTGVEWGGYFTEKFRELTEMGQSSLLNALYVGALIEELDMNDIIYCPQEIVDTVYSITDKTQCGQVYTDESAILQLYQNLLNGSANHLKAFVYNIELFIGEGKYEAQYLTQDEVDEILGR